MTIFLAARNSKEAKTAGHFTYVLGTSMVMLYFLVCFGPFTNKRTIAHTILHTLENKFK